MNTNTRFLYRARSPSALQKARQPSQAFYNSLPVRNTNRSMFRTPTPSRKTHATPTQLPTLTRSPGPIMHSQRQYKVRLEQFDVAAEQYGVRLPPHVRTNVFTITYQESSRPAAVGVLIAESILLTAYSALPSPIRASTSVFFPYRMRSRYKAIPSRFFYMNPEKGITAVFISSDRPVASKLLPLESETVLDEEELVYYVSDHIYHSAVYRKAPDLFLVKSAHAILPGSVCFNTNWDLKGVCVGSNDFYQYHTFLPVAYVAAQIPRFQSSVEGIVWSQVYKPAPPVLQEKPLVWIEWGGQFVELYSCQSNSWNSDRVKGVPREWKFPGNSRVVHLPDGSVLIVGGESYQQPLNSVFLYNPADWTLRQMASMRNPRASTALAYFKGHVYAITGKYCSTACEVYDVKADEWRVISNCFFQRCNHSAVALNGRIYSVGGEPLVRVSPRIECFDINAHEWEVLFAKLPALVKHPPLCVLSSAGFLVLGGSKSKDIFFVDCTQEPIVKKVGVLRQPLESVYEVWYFQKDHRFLVLDSSAGHDSPMLFKVHENSIDWGLIPGSEE